jgi:peptidoglycan/xylan/chitin deacetylase (PgdA/CDA1 family)
VLSNLATAGAVTVAASLAYHCYAPTSQLYGRTLTRCPEANQLALTFDDGPNDVHTEHLLEVLGRHKVKATFFLIGRFVAMRPQVARAIAEGGHLIANHTYSHPNLLFLSRSQVLRELSDCSKAIADATGVDARFFRPPFGARRPAVLQEAREFGLEPVMWDVTCFDWRRTTADRVEAHARKRIERDRGRGHIVLMHDGGHTDMGVDRSHTVEATESLIQRYKDDYQFRRIDEIQLDHPA